MGIHSKEILIIAVVFLISSCSLWVEVVRASDPDPLLDFAPNVSDFVFRDVFTNGAITNGPGGIRAGLNISIYPALTSLGITFVQFKLKPCGENLPHTHPRATEILTLVSGGPIQAGFVDTKGMAHIYILYPGDIIIFPRALLHFELNVGNTTAFFISALNSQNPGVLTAGGALLKLPNRAAAGALNQDIATVEKLKSQIYTYSEELQMDMRNGCIPGKDITINF